MSLHVVPVELSEANEYVATLHRHHQPVVGHRFSLGVMDDSGSLVGIAIVGRPVARNAGHPRDVLEVTRIATDGTRNAPSMLLGAAARAGRAMGYLRIQTYTLPEEGGASLRGAGWTFEGEAGGVPWKHRDGKPRRSDQPNGVKWRWSCDLCERPDLTDLPHIEDVSSQIELFGGAA